MITSPLAASAGATVRSIATTGRTRASRRPVLLVGLLAVLLCACHLLVLHQGAHWTSPLLIGDHLFDLGLALAILWFGLALGRRVARPLLGLDDDRLTDTLAALGLGLGILSLAILLAGFLRLYHGPVFVAAFMALTAWLRRELWQSLRWVRDAGGAWLRAGAPTAPMLAQRLILLVLALALLVLLVEATVPVGWGSPVEWDAPAYHLAAPKIYLAAHRFVPLPDIDLANAPSGQEMIYLLGLAAGSDGLGKMLSVLGLPLLGLATFACCRRHFGSQAAWLSLFLLATVHWLGIEAPTTLPDFASFTLLLLSLSDALAWLDCQALASRADRPRPWYTALLAVERGDRLLLRSGILLGLAICDKLTNLPGIPALALTVALLGLCRSGPGLGRRVAVALRGGAIAGLAAAAVFSPWLLKNIYFFGHPFYQISVAVSTPTVGSVGATTAAQHSLIGHLQWMAGNMVDIAWHSISPLCLVLPLAPLLLRRPSQQGAMAFLLIGGTFWLAFVPRFVEPRYYVGLIAIGEMLIAAVLADLLARIPHPDRPLRLLPGRLRLRAAALLELPLDLYLLLQAFVLLALCLAQAIDNRAQAVALGQVSRTEYLAARVRPFPAEDWVNRQTSPDAVIALLGVSRGYYLDRTYQADWYGRVLATIEQDRAARQARLALWCRTGVRYVLLDRGDDRLDDDHVAAIRPLAGFAWVRTPGLLQRVAFSAHGVDVLRINPCAALRGPR